MAEDCFGLWQWRRTICIVNRVSLVSQVFRNAERTPFSNLWTTEPGSSLAMALSEFRRISRTFSDFESSLTTETIEAAVYGNGIFVAGLSLGPQDSRLVPTGSSGSGRVRAGFPLVQTLAYGNGVFVAADEQGGIATSQDGFIWTQSRLRATTGISGMAWGNNRFVCSGL